MNEAFIAAAARTAGGRKHGRLKDWHPADLGAAVVDALLDRINVDPGTIEDAIWDCDGAAALIVASLNGLQRLGAKPLARIHQMTVIGGDPVVMLETPIEATALPWPGPA